MELSCIHIAPPPGRVVRTSPFSCWRWGSELMILILTARIGYTAVGVGGDWPNWMQDVMLAVAVFCSVFSLRAPASTSLGVCPSRTSSSWLGDPTLDDISSSEDHRFYRRPRDFAVQAVSADRLCRAS